MDTENKNRVSLYVLNDFLMFDRKIYQLFGLKLGRPIKLKTIMYFFVISVIELVIFFTPIIGNLINWLPFIILVLIPAGLSYLLSDVRTEGRIPIAYFRSVFLYHIRKVKKVTYFRGREVSKPTTYKFSGYSTVTFAEDRSVDGEFKPKEYRFKVKSGISELYAKDKNVSKGELM